VPAPRVRRRSPSPPVPSRRIVTCPSSRKIKPRAGLSLADEHLAGLDLQPLHVPCHAAHGLRLDWHPLAASFLPGSQRLYPAHEFAGAGRRSTSWCIRVRGRGASPTSRKVSRICSSHHSTAARSRSGNVRQRAPLPANSSRCSWPDVRAESRSGPGQSPTSRPTALFWQN